MKTEQITQIHKVPLAEQLSASNTSILKRYQEKVLKEGSLLKLAYYELLTLLFANLPGSLGYLSRKSLYKSLFHACGSGVIFGQGLTLRNPQRMVLGDRVAIDDYCLLDATGTGVGGFRIGDDVIISRNSVIQAKSGVVSLGNKVDVGCNVVLSSVNGITIGNSVLIAGNCYIGGGRYLCDRIDIPMMEQGVYSKGPILIGDDVWLGAGATVLDGVTIGRGCIIGAGALVTRDLPDYSVAVGVPAKIIKSRAESSQRSVS